MKLRRLITCPSSLFHSVPRFFLTDDDPANPGDPGDPNGRPGGGSDGGSPEKKAEPETYTVKVNGKEVTLTLPELIERASEASGAQAKFQEAADLRKQFEGLDPSVARKGAQVLKMGARLAQGETLNDAEAKQFFELLGFDPSNLPAPEQSPAGGKGKEAPKKLAFEDLPEDVQKQLKYVQDQQYTATEQKINQDIRKTVDKDSIIGKIVGKVPQKQREAYQNALYEMAEDVTWSLIGNGRGVGQGLYDEVVQRLRSRVAALGTPSNPDDLPASLAVGNLGMFGPGVGSDEPIKRKRVTDAGYDDNASARLMQDMILRRRQAAGR